MKKTIILIFILPSLFFSLAYADVNLTGVELNKQIDQLDRISRLINQAEQGDMLSQYQLGKMYSFGLGGVARDKAESKKWYTLAAQQGYLFAQLSLARDYREVYDYENALKWYKVAAEQGDVEGQYSTGKIYANVNYAKKDLTEAMKWYKLAAEQHDNRALYELGNISINEKDYENALKFYQSAAKLGSDDAQSRLGFMYCTGTGVTRNLAEAEKWVTLPNDGHSQGAFNLANMYFNGLCGEENKIQGMKMLEFSANRQNGLAQNRLGNIYSKGSEGLGVEQNDLKAKEWYQKACSNRYMPVCESDE